MIQERGASYRARVTGRKAQTSARARVGGPDTAVRVRRAALVLQERGWFRGHDPAGAPAAPTTKWEMNPAGTA